MNAFVSFPAQLHWSADELAAAVPLRLHERFALDAVPNEAMALNTDDKPRNGWRHGDYLRDAGLPPFFRMH